MISYSSGVNEFHHPDRLGTKLVTNGGSGSWYQQSTLPFGTAFNAESGGYSNQVFTSYDRSAGTGLDYAVNRTYSSGQSRFTQVDPIGMAAASIGNPQSNNLYAYVQNMPTDFVDPSGLNAMGVSYYVDGILTTASHAWAHIYGGGGYILSSDVGGLTVIGSWEERFNSRTERWEIRNFAQRFHLFGTGAGSSAGETIGGGGDICLTGIPVFLGQIRPSVRFPFGTGRGSWRRSLGTSPSRGRFGQTNQPWYGQHLNSRWGRQERLDAMAFAGGNPGRFKQLAGRRSGYDWHHVVEQNQTQFGSLRLNSIGNMIQIPRSLHNKISGHYQSNVPGTGQTVRQWLRSQSFEAQHAYGIRVLQQFGAIPCGQ